MAKRTNASAMGALFLLIAGFLGGIAAFAVATGQSTGAWIVAVASVAIGGWFLTLSLKAFRAARRARH